jgi:hypothetical protein
MGDHVFPNAGAASWTCRFSRAKSAVESALVRPDGRVAVWWTEWLQRIAQGGMAVVEVERMG